MKDSSNTVVVAATHAAENAAAAALSASNAARTAADNAAIAAKAAAESATAIAVVATDTSWMKKSLEGIELTLNEINKAFVTSVQHEEVLKKLDNHENRINNIEDSNARLLVLVGIGGTILGIFFYLLINHLLGK